MEIMENISPKVEYKSSKFEQKSPRPPARHRRPLRRHSTIAQMPGVDQVKPLDYPAAQSQKNVSTELYYELEFRGTTRPLF